MKYSKGWYLITFYHTVGFKCFATHGTTGASNDGSVSGYEYFRYYTGNKTYSRFRLPCHVYFSDIETVLSWLYRTEFVRSHTIKITKLTRLQLIKAGY